MKKFYSFVLFLAFSVNVFASIPALTGRVVDNANILDASIEQILTEKLEVLDKVNGTELAILTVKSLEGMSIDEFGVEVAEFWRLGKSGKDNGILITIAVDEHELRIDVGYGLNGILTATKTGIIRREYMNPYFAQGDFNKGVIEGVNAIIGCVCNDEDIVNAINKIEEEQKHNSNADTVISLIVVGFMLFIFTSGSGIGPFGLWIWISLLTGKPFVRHRSHRRFDDDDFHFGGSSRGGGFGGGRGGGFSGGGGHFGGGGSSGKW